MPIKAFSRGDFAAARLPGGRFSVWRWRCSARRAASRQAVRSGYLCCNLREYKEWISDINYRFEGTRLLRAGSPVQVQASYAKYATVRIGGRELSLGNDYSRDLSQAAFLQRYVVPTDPNLKLGGYDEFTQDAIANSRVMPGMTEEQVLMALGYPVASYTASLRNRHWKYWLDRSGEFGVHWDDERRVRRLSGDWSALSRVVYAPPRDVVKAMQQALNDAGMEAGEVDGLLGSKTYAAIRRYQEREKLNRSGFVDLATLDRLGVTKATSSTVVGGPPAGTSADTAVSVSVGAAPPAAQSALPTEGPDRLSAAVGGEAPPAPDKAGETVPPPKGKLPY
ncbi:MAG: peptidoglycan-binding protein [Burkholderiaceae bacterium]